MRGFRHTVILVVLSALSANAYPQLVRSYGAPLGIPSGEPIGEGNSNSRVLGVGFGRPCNGDEVRNVIGECVLPEISRNIFVYAAPKAIPSPRPRLSIPKPEVHYDFVFVKTPDQLQQNDPIVLPPPQQKTLVYVLSKKQEQNGESIIRSPYTPAPRPEVFYVSYGEGDNPQLPGGVDLESALSSGATQGQNLNFQNPNFGTSQKQANNFVDDTRSLPGSDERTVPAINNQPIEGGFISGGAVRSGILLNGGIPIVQGPVKSGFEQVDATQQPSGSAAPLNNPIISQEVQEPSPSLSTPPQAPVVPIEFPLAPVTASLTGLQYPPLPLSAVTGIPIE